MKKTMRMFLTGACSALIAWIIINEISPEKSTIWGLVGSILSFFLGYISWEFEVVLNAIKNTLEKISIVNWKKVGNEIGRFFIVLLIIWPFSFFWMLLFSYLIVFLISGISGLLRDLSSLLIIFWGCFTFFLGSLFSLEFTHRIGDVKLIVRKANPFSVFVFWPLWLLYKIPTFIRFLVSKKEKMKKAAKSIFEFLYTIYREIHAYFRLAVGVDSLIGFSVGYFLLDNILIGALISGTLVVINYYIIGIKILRLKPAEIS